MTSVTPFGSTGPYSNYKGPDLVVWAMSGYMYCCGSLSEPPYRVSLPQSYYQAGLHAAMASVIALYYRDATGSGQHVDTSAQEACGFFTETAMPMWDLYKTEYQRAGPGWLVPRKDPLGPLWLRFDWPCKDGTVKLYVAGGAQEGLVHSSKEIVKMANDAGMATGIRDYDWENQDASQITQEERLKIEEQIGEFLLTRTRRELFDAALKKGVALAPSNSIKDVLENPQLASRDYFVDVEHPELNDIITYPGAPAKLSEVPWRIARRSPLIGEHNKEILGSEEIELKSIVANTFSTQEKAVEIHHRKQQPFEGVKIVEFAWVAAGPQIARTLAEHGAMVIRIESHRRPDLSRLIPPYKDYEPGIDRSAFFAMLNTNKYGISLDISKPRGKYLATKLIEWADIVTESFAPGVMKKLGLDYEEVRKIKPDIIYASTCMQGQYGPHALFQGYGDHLAALSGISELIGRPDGEPSMATLAYTDFIAPWYVVIALVGALMRRDRTGRGMYIDQSQYEAVVTFLAQGILDYSVNGRNAQRIANRDPNAAPHGAYPCKGQDRWCVIAVFTDDNWKTFRTIIGDPEWARDPVFSTLAGRKQNEDKLDRYVSQWTTNHTAEEVMSLMQSHGVPAGIVYGMEDLFKDAQLKHRRHFVYLDHPVIGPYASYNQASLFSKTPPNFWKPAPCLGEDNESIFRDVLGLTDDEIADLFVEGVITTDADIPSLETV
jgi:crotonobetainyl-CoA:carnitine CoA-transferase CaiB-like acyl-CoA transferase